MVQKNKKTALTNRKFVFASFKDRVDSIKIEPNLKLSKRVYDEADTSHFITTLDHWREINLSGNFNEFCYKINRYSNSLPQIIHHQKEIFDALYEHLSCHDIYSSQPLLELLSQFVHDLGPDFMPYYERAIELLTSIALETNPNDIQNSTNSSNLLEWLFNCLTFMFKYLSKSLTIDSRPTFNILLPILLNGKRNYMSRFCSEAVSFLIKKMSSDQLTLAMNFLLVENYHLISENPTYKNSLIVIFSESIKSSKESFHSKAIIIYSQLLEMVFSHLNTAVVLSGLISEIFSHGNENSVERFLKVLLEKISNYLKSNSSIHDESMVCIIELMVVLVFSESGKKIMEWNPVFDVTATLFNTIDSNTSSVPVADSSLYLCTTLIRNSEIITLSKNIKFIVDFVTNLQNGSQFLRFVDSSLSTCEQKLTSLNIKKYLQDYVNSLDSDNFIQLAYLLSRRPDLELFVPVTKVNDIVLTIKFDNDLTTLIDNYWKLYLINYSSGFNFPTTKLFTLLSKLNFDDTKHNLFFGDFMAQGMQTCLKSNNNDFNDVILKTLDSNFHHLQSSSHFLDVYLKVLKTIPVDKDSIYGYVESVAENMCMNSPACRLSSISFIIDCFDLLKIDYPEIYSQIRLIDQIPMNPSTARVIQMRIRNLISSYNSIENKNDLDCKILTYFLFGLLTNKFQPCWITVYDSLPQISGTCGKYIWELAFTFMTKDYSSQSSNYVDSNLMSIESESVIPRFSDQRLIDNFANLEENHYIPYRLLPQSLIDKFQDLSTNLIYPTTMRAQCLEALMKVPEIAEEHNQELLTLLLGFSDHDDNQINENWSIKEKNSLVSLFSKFKSLKSIKNNDKLYEVLLLVLSSKTSQAQKLALDVIINFKNPSINKYKDNLKNLLDDTLFRDEIPKLITKPEDSLIEFSDTDSVMPLILRILFGRVQGASKSNSQSSKKHTVMNTLPTLNDDLIVEFLGLGARKLEFQSFMDTKDVSEKDLDALRMINGYIYLLSELYDTLGYKFVQPLTTTVEPLIYSLAVSQRKIDLVSSDNQEKSEVDNDFKTAKSIRQVGMKCLSQIFTILGDNYDWNKYFPIMYQFIIEPRLDKFAEENLQQVSSLMKLITGWIKRPNFSKFLLFDEIRPAKAIFGLLEHEKAKSSVTSTVLDFAIDCLRITINDDDYYSLLALLVDCLLRNLPFIISNSSDNEIIAKSVTVLLLLIDGDYISEDNTRISLLEALTGAFGKPVNKIASDDRQRILTSVAALIREVDMDFDDFIPYYNTYSKAFQIYSDKQIRQCLVDLFGSISSKFVEFEKISDLLEGINSFENDRAGSPNFERRLACYKEINEHLYSSFTTFQWLPIVYCALFFINDEDELVIRSSATYVLNHYIDCYSQTDETTAQPYITLFKNVIIPNLKDGLKAKLETIQGEYLNVLAHAVRHSNHYTDFQDMKILLFDNDDEANFFSNINHIQLHRRQRAMRRVAEFRNQLSCNNIYHYILPIIENYSYTTEEKLRNVSNESIKTIGLLVRCLSWNQFKSFIRRYVSKLKTSNEDTLKNSVLLVVEASRSLYLSIEAKKSTDSNDVLKEFPKSHEEIDSLVVSDLIPPISTILNERNDETIVKRIQLSEALVNLVRCISEKLASEQLPGLLTSTCQVLRSRNDELRDASRKSLCKIARDLGPKYFKFLLQELKSALTRGSQIHVLSFTMHAILVAIQDILEHGDLDLAVPLVVDIIMEDTFGAAGQEKDAEGYTTKMKEVKHKKSYDSAEILSSNISLSNFGQIIDPIKLVLQERISLKVQNKLDELLKRFALGLNHNEESTSRNVLLLSYELNQQADDIFRDENDHSQVKNSEKDGHKSKHSNNQHFLVSLNAKPFKTQVDYTQYLLTLKKFSFEILRAAVSRHDSLLTVSNMEQFVPMLETSIGNGHEGLTATSLRLLNTVMKLTFPENINNVFKTCARKALNIIKDSPSTNLEVCQASLRYLATLLRHKPEVTLKDTSISYVLIRIQPDLEEPQTQGLAFNFLRSVISQHILVPEVYDVMDTVSKIMIVNHNREIRDMARSIYFQFLMEYDQGRGKLENQFKFLVKNLGYATQDGRKSVLELINSIVHKSGDQLLLKLSSSFFVALANTIVNDDSSKCREMATAIVQKIFKNLGIKRLDNIEQYIIAWIGQLDNTQLLRCGLNIYKIYLSQFGLSNDKLDKLALSKIESVVKQSANHEGDDVEWPLVYGALNVYSTICSVEKQKIVSKKYEDIWLSIIDTLLFPHSWVRLSSSRLVGVLLSNLDKCDFKIEGYTIQTIAYRLLRQLSAPSISEDLGDQVIKNLVIIAMKWQKEGTKFINKESEKENRYNYAIEFLVHRANAITRQDLRGSNESKKAAIKLCAMLIQILQNEALYAAVEEVLLSLYNFIENDGLNDTETELVEYATDCRQLIENKIGGTKYTEIFAKVQKSVTLRRQERKTKRAQMAVTAPDVAARRKLKKHERTRDKRKHEKDEMGYYHSKKRRA